MIGPQRHPGRPEKDWRRSELMRKFGFTLFNPARDLTQTELDQLYACKDDSARRLLLGISEKVEP